LFGGLADDERTCAGNEGSAKMLVLGNVTFDCGDPNGVADFWGEALGYQVAHVSSEQSWAAHPDGVRPNLMFMKVPEPRAAKNRVHLDLVADDRVAEVRRLIELGATQGETQDMPAFALTFTVMQDPEGNELCVAQFTQP
jgi:hypothetical protein